LHILLIDDEPRRAQPLIAYFKEIMGWEIEQALGPDEALAYLPPERSCPFDLILLDIMMPPGLTISKEASNQGRNTGLILLGILFKRTDGNVPILVYTARVDLDFLQEDPRVATFIQKPQMPSEVARIIKAVIAIRRAES